MDTKPDLILLVDEQGRPAGEEDKWKCHEGEGLLHGAFLVMVFDPAGRLMLARRSAQKPLWPDYWDGTLASHYRLGADRDATARERVFDEIGVRNGIPHRLFDFRYQAAYRDIGSENELCDLYVLDGVPREAVSLRPEEISECRYLPLDEAEAEAASAPGGLTPWFLIALRMLLDRRPKGL